MVIDCHVHVFPKEIIRNRDEICLKEPGFSLLYGKRDSKMASYEDLTAYLDSFGIESCFCLAFPFKDRSLIRLTNDYILSSPDKERMVPFINLDFYDPEWSLEELERCLSQGARGVGEVAFYERSMGKEEFERIKILAKAIRERDGILILHVNEQIGHRYPGKVKIDFEAISEFVEELEGLKIVLSHFGGGIPFYEFMPEVKKAFSNVYYDLAAVPLIYDPKVSEFIERFVPEKVIFGSDFPLLTLKRYTQLIESLPMEIREKILYLNASTLLGKV